MFARHSFHIYPEANTRRPVQRAVDARGKLALDSVERNCHSDTRRLTASGTSS
jgi:hypothetical protein